MPHLYRKTRRHAIAAFAGIFLLCSFSVAEGQRPQLNRPKQPDADSASQHGPEKPKTRGPRAIGVVEFLPGGATRLVPIALWMDGKYYDASLYAASPEPMALEPGTVYEAQALGETTGTFVVKTPKLVNGNWAADGSWKPHLAMDAKLASDAAKQPKIQKKESRAIFTDTTDTGPPVLHRAGGSGTSSQGSSGQTPNSQDKDQPQPSSSGGSSGAPSSSGSSSSKPGGANSGSANPNQSASSDNGRPTLGPGIDDQSQGGKPSASSNPAGGSTDSDDPNRPVLHRAPPGQSASSASDDDPDRPIMRKTSAPDSSPTAAQPGSSQPGGPASDDNDPDRPVLTRGGTATSSSSKSGTKSPATGASAVAGKTGPPGIVKAGTTPSGSTRAYPAISDAGRYESRSLLYSMTPEEREQKAPPMLALALADIRAFASKRPGPQIPKAAKITDYDLRVYDLDFSNSPTLVLSAKLPMASTTTKPFTYYATIVAHLDINGDTQKIFSSVTDTAHLDVYSRMELIDALDADANGRGDLLFRQYSDTGLNYGLYRVFPYQMEKIFEGGSSL